MVMGIWTIARSLDHTNSFDELNRNFNIPHLPPQRGFSIVVNAEEAISESFKLDFSIASYSFTGPIVPTHIFRTNKRI